MVSVAMPIITVNADSLQRVLINPFFLYGEIMGQKVNSN
jgi:hypothetical protein